MIYLAHTAHWQLMGLVVGSLAWIFTLITAGLNEWRLWYVEDTSIITSGVAWVGIWKACFYSHALPSLENCYRISISDTFVPVEIPVAQVLMILAMICGLVGSISAGVAVRMVYFSMEDRKNIRLVFVLAGALYLLSGTFSLVPLVWNMSSVLNNSTIDFPPEFHLPPAPVSQRVGSAVGVGIFASTLMLISGLVFLCYRYAWRPLSSETPKDTRYPLHGPCPVTTLPQRPDLSNAGRLGMDNPAFHSELMS